MPYGTTAQRSFSDDKHASGQWRTRSVAHANPIARAALSFLSYKRAGVERLARRASGPSPAAVDLGAGQGAYARAFLAARPGAKVIAVDWSPAALRRIADGRGKLLRLCADAQHLPLKAGIADALFSIDTLGHIPSINLALDEILRIAKPGAPLFLHSECGSYRNRWPDTMLAKRIGFDYLAKLDGHITVLPYAELHALVARRFIIDEAWSPAGLAGWLTGHPEKYRLAFDAAGCKTLALLTAFFALVKRLPVLGVLLRLCNAISNHLELALGIQGGGSFFARARIPERVTPERTAPGSGR
jgi:ubiquinone/menaquinone biosynthesis C-methylase UbiE